MTNRKRILTVASAVVIGTLACLIGYSYGVSDSDFASGLSSSIAELMPASDHMADQMVTANCEGVKQSIVDYLKLLEKYRNMKGEIITETTYYGDLMLGHLRLALIEEHQGNQREKLRHLEIAKEVCSHRKFKDCSEDKLIWYAKRRDEKHPIACLGNEDRTTKPARPTGE